MHVLYAAVHGVSGGLTKVEEQAIAEAGEIPFDRLPSIIQEEISKTTEGEKWTN